MLESDDVDLLRRAVTRWERMVDLPEPDSPLERTRRISIQYDGGISHYATKQALHDLRNTALWLEAGGALQKHDSLVLGAVSEPKPGTVGNILGTARSTALLASIYTLTRRRVGVE